MKNKEHEISVIFTFTYPRPWEATVYEYITVYDVTTYDRKNIGCFRTKKKALRAAKKWLKSPAARKWFDSREEVSE
jgi:hypothetical protein